MLRVPAATGRRAGSPAMYRSQGGRRGARRATSPKAGRLCEIVELGGIVPTFPSQADALSDLTAAAGHRGE